MPRTLTAGIAALKGVQRTAPPIILLEWFLPSPVGTLRLSSSSDPGYGGNAWQHNRVLESLTFEHGLMDGDSIEFEPITLKFENLTDNRASSAWYFSGIDAQVIFEDTKVIIYAYHPISGEAVDIWQGRALRPEFNGEDYSVSVQFNYLWDVLDIPYPSKTLSEMQFATLDVDSRKGNEDDDDVIPQLYGQNFKVRPKISYAWTDGFTLNVNAVLSGISPGKPFASDAIAASTTKLFGRTPATALIFRPGNQTTAHPDLTKFPDGLPHENVAYFWAAFPITQNDRFSLDDLESHDIKMHLNTGRPLLATSLPSENFTHIIKDVLRDAVYSVGRPAMDFNDTVITNTANYTGTRYQCDAEVFEQENFLDVIQALLADSHSYITEVNGKVEIRAYRNDETPVATFSAINGAVSSIRRIHNDHVNGVKELSFRDIPNQIAIEHRTVKRQKPRKVIVYDPVAQNYSGVEKPVTHDRTAIGLRDEEQIKINAAIYLRNKIAANMYVPVTVPMWDGIDIVPGDIINAYSPDIWNNGVNNTFRVRKCSYDFGEEPLITFHCQVYFQSIFADSYAGLGVDILRGSDDVSEAGRAPDILSPTLVRVGTGDSEDGQGTQVTLRAGWAYPAQDTAGEADFGIKAKYPISYVQLWGRYADEGINALKLYSEVKYPALTADILVEFHKNRQFELFFVTLNEGRGRGPFGYVPDLTKTSYLTAGLNTGTNLVAQVADGSLFAVNDYILTEFEFNRILSKSGNSLTLYNNGTNRNVFFDSERAAHGIGTQVAVAKRNYPSLTVPLNNLLYTYPIVTGLTARPRDDGVKVTWNDPNKDNEEWFYLYWSTDGDAHTNAAKLGVANPAWYFLNPLVPPTGVNLRKVRDLNTRLLFEEIGIGVTVQLRISAGNKKNTFSSQLSAIASNSATGPNVDTAIPSGLTTPVIHGQKNGVIAKKMTALTSNRSHIRTEIVFKVVNDAGTLINYVNPATRGATADENLAKIDVSKSGHYNLNMSKEQFIAAFGGPTDRNVSVHFYVTNSVGTSLVSPSPTTANDVPFSQLDQDPLAPDTAVPSGLSKPLLNKNKGSITAKKMFATTNANQEQYKEVVFEIVDASDNSFTMFNPETGTITGPEFRTNIGTGGHKEVEFNRAQLEADLGALFFTHKIRAYYYVTNLIGTSAKSPNSDPILLTALVDSLGDEIVVPSGLQVPLLISRRNVLTVQQMRATTNNSKERFKELVFKIVTNAGGLVGYINPANNTLTASEAVAKIVPEKSGHYSLTISKEQILAMTGGVTADRNVAAHYYVHNKAGSSAVSSNSNLISFAALETDPMMPDTGPPNNGVAIIINRAKLKGGKALIVDHVPPVAQMNTFSKMVLIIHDNNSTGTGRKFFDVYTATWAATYPDGSTELTWGKSFPDIAIDKNAIFVGGRTQFYVRVGFYNAFNGGSVTYSGDLSTPVTQASSDVDPLGGDNAVPSSLSAPLLRHDKGKLIIRNMHADANNNQELYKEVALEIVNASDVNVGQFDPDTGTLAGPIVWINVGKSGHKEVKFNRAQLESDLGGLFATHRIRATYRVINTFGTSATATPSNSIALVDLVDSLGDDIIAPTGLQAPTLIGRRQALTVQGMRSTGNSSKVQYKDLVFRVQTNAGVQLGFINPADGSVTGSEATARINVGGSGHHTLIISRSKLIAGFGGPTDRNVVAYYYVTNKGGTSVASALSNIISFASLKADLTEDDAGASAPQNIDLHWRVKAGTRLTYFRPASNFDSLIHYRIRYLNTTGTRQMNPNDGNSTSSIGLYDIFEVDVTHKTNLRRDQIHPDFQAGLKAEITAITRVNGAETLGTTGTSSTLVISSQNEVINSRDSVYVLDVFTLMISPGQVCENGDWLYSTTAGGTTVDKFKRRASPFTSDANINTTNTNALFWIQIDHCGVWRNSAERLYSPLKVRFLPGEFFAITFMAKTDGSLSNPLVTVRIRDNSNNDLTETALPITLTGLTTSYQMYGGVLRMATTASPTSNKFLSFESSVTLSLTNNIIMDKFMYVRGKQPFAFTARSLYEQGPLSTVAGLSEDFDISAVSTGTPDLGQSSGTQGGFFNSGTGGRFQAL